MYIYIYIYIYHTKTVKIIFKTFLNSILENVLKNETALSSWMAINNCWNKYCLFWIIILIIINIIIYLLLLIFIIIYYY